MHTNARKLLVGFGLLLFAVSGMATEAARATEAHVAQSRQVRVLVLIVEADHPYRIALASTIDSDDLKNKEKPPESMREAALVRRVFSLESTLYTTMTGFNRRVELMNAMYRAFSNESVFELAEAADYERYVVRKKLHSLKDTARTEGYDFVLVLEEEFVGLVSHSVLQTRAGLLRPVVAVEMILIDVQGIRPVYRRTLRAAGVRAAHYDDAVAHQRFFSSQWPGMSTRIANSVTADLSFANQLHAMAERGGRGGEVPAVGAILANYSKRLHWDVKSAKGWRMRQSNSDFTRIFDQKDRTAPSMQVRFDVDLLVPELGQEVSSIREYLPIYEKRRAEQGGTSTLTPFEEISAPGFTAYFVGNERGSGEIVLFKKIHDQAMQIVSAKFAGDFAESYRSNRASIESLVANGIVRMD